MLRFCRSSWPNSARSTTAVRARTVGVEEFAHGGYLVTARAVQAEHERRAEGLEGGLQILGDRATVVASGDHPEVRKGTHPSAAMRRAVAALRGRTAPSSRSAQHARMVTKTRCALSRRARSSMRRVRVDVRASRR